MYLGLKKPLEQFPTQFIAETVTRGRAWGARSMGGDGPASRGSSGGVHHSGMGQNAKWDLTATYRNRVRWGTLSTALPSGYTRSESAERVHWPDPPLQ